MSLLARSRSLGSLHVDKKFTLNQSPMELVVEFEMGFGYDDFVKAVEMLKKATGDRWYAYLNPVCYYREPANVYYRNKNHIKTEFQCRFFDSDNRLAYTPSGRSGWLIHDMSYHLVERIVVRHRDHEEIQSAEMIKQEKLWKRISKARYDEQTWSSLTKDSFRENRHPFFYIKKVFDSYDMNRIKKGFENKETFHIHKEGKDRHWTAEGKVCEDGIYRGWFSSEYSGCANGDYYYLLNPTTAVFCETD